MLSDSLLGVTSMVRAGLTVSIIVLISGIISVLSSRLPSSLDGHDILELGYPLL